MCYSKTSQRNEVATMVANINKVDVSYVRKIINGTYIPKKPEAIAKAKTIKDTYRKLTSGLKNNKKELIRSVKQSVKA
jgi:hypothetical protein